MILAGGPGTRVRDLAPDLPKALIPVCGEPFAFHQLRLLAGQGIENVVYVVGYRAAQIRDAVGGGDAFGLKVTYVDEGDKLHGTGGALRVALDEGALPPTFGVLYGDSYLPIELEPVFAAFDATERPALMTVYRNDDRWDQSNAVLEDGVVTLYDKRPEARDSRMAWIDYGFSVLRREVVEAVPREAVVDLAEMYRSLTLGRDLAGFEVRERFYEVGSRVGRTELERHLAADVVR